MVKVGLLFQKNKSLKKINELSVLIYVSGSKVSWLT